MENLLKITNEILQSEYPETSPELEVIYGESIESNNPITYHGVIILNYTRNNKRIRCYIFRISQKTSVKPDLKIDIKRNFIHNLLFAVGPLCIRELLSGESEPYNSTMIW